MEQLIIKKEKTNDEDLKRAISMEGVMEQDLQDIGQLESISSDVGQVKSSDAVFHVGETKVNKATQPLPTVSVSAPATLSSQLRMVTLTGGRSSEAPNNQILVASNNQMAKSSADVPKGVTKFIIAPKGVSGQQVLSVSPAFNTSSAGLIGQPGVAGTFQVANSPTKTYTLSQGGILSSEKQITSATNFTGARLQLSPAKTPPKQTVITFAKSPGKQQQFVMLKPGVATGSSGRLGSSPSKIVIRGQTPVTLASSGEPSQHLLLSQNTNTSRVSSGQSAVGSVQPLSVSGSKFQYVRLVTAPSSQSQGTPVVRATNIAPAPQRALAPSSSATHMKVVAANTNQNIPVAQQKQTSSTQQRLILPATSQVLQAQTLGSGVRSVSTTSGSGTILSSTSNVGPTINLPGLQGFALIPAQYITQPAAQTQQSQPPSVKQETFHVAPANNNKQNTNINGRTSSSAESQGQRPRKPCNCTKSQCLKLYCDCFANGEFCSNCNCNNCFNNLDHEEERQRAIKTCLERNPHAFHPKIGKGRGGSTDRRHNKGCNCKRSGCLKNYCECYEAKIMCSNLCKCVGCKNFEESPDRKTLMHLADAAEVRHQQQTAAKTKLSSQIQDLPTRPPPPATGQRLPYTFVTPEVAEATCACLVAQAEEAERTRQQEMMEECMIIQEFGRCLMQVIQSATKTKAPSPVP